MAGDGAAQSNSNRLMLPKPPTGKNGFSQGSALASRASGVGLQDPETAAQTPRRMAASGSRGGANGLSVPRSNMLSNGANGGEGFESPLGHSTSMSSVGASTVYGGSTNRFYYGQSEEVGASSAAREFARQYSSTSFNTLNSNALNGGAFNGGVMNGGADKSQGYGYSYGSATQRSTISQSQSQLQSQSQSQSLSQFQISQQRQHSLTSQQRILTRDETIIGQRTKEHRIKVPKRIVREEMYETVVIVPEKRMTEEVIEEDEIVRERIVEVAKAVQVEKIVEVPEYEYKEKIVEVPQIEVRERVTHVPKIEVKEREVHVPKVRCVTKVVDVPQVEYRQVPHVKRVDVHQLQEEIVYKEKAVPQYIDTPTPVHKEVEKPYDVHLQIPVPITAEMVCDFEIPQIEEVVNERHYDVFVPKFVQKPVPAFLLDSFYASEARKLDRHVALAAQNQLTLVQADALQSHVRNENLAQRMAAYIQSHGTQNLASQFTQHKIAVEPSKPSRLQGFGHEAEYKARSGRRRRHPKRTKFVEPKREGNCVLDWLRSWTSPALPPPPPHSYKKPLYTSANDLATTSANHTYGKSRRRDDFHTMNSRMPNFGDEYPVFQMVEPQGHSRASDASSIYSDCTACNQQR